MLFPVNLALAATLLSTATAAPDPVVITKHLTINMCKPADTIVAFSGAYGTGFIPSGIETSRHATYAPPFSPIPPTLSHRQAPPLTTLASGSNLPEYSLW